MLLRLLTLVSSLTLTAQGFLISPSISSSIGQDPENLLIHPESPTQRVVRLDCPGCVYASKGQDGHARMEENVPNHLVMKFSIKPSDDIGRHEALYLNGVQLYPLPARFPGPITAVQVASTADGGQNNEKEDSPSVPLSTHTTIKSISNAMVLGGGGGEVMTLELRIKAVNEKPVDGLPVVKATFFRTGGSNGKLMIARVETIKESHPTLSPIQQEKTGGAKECTSRFPVLCKWRAIIMHKIHKAKSAFRGCHRRVRLHLMRIAHRLPHHRVHHHQHHNHHNKIQKIDPFAIPHLIPHPHKSNTNTHSQTQQPHEMEISTPPTHHYYQPPHPQVHKHSMIHTIRRIYIHIIVPIFIGIAAGMTASLLGLVIGQLVVVLWRRFYRRSASPYTGISQVDEEKERFLDDGETQYEDVSTMTNMGVGVHVVEKE